jgi:hypothetical protein
MPHAENSNCKPALCDEIDPKRTEEPDPKLLQSIARAHHWASALANNTYKSIDDLAAKATLHLKVARNKLRLVFLSPEIHRSHPDRTPDRRPRRLTQIILIKLAEINLMS